MSIDWASVAKDFFDRLPHPHDPSGHLKIGEYATAVKLATLARFGGHASAHEAGLFWREFAPGGVPIMSPEEFEHTLERIAPLSYTYHGRPPTMKEIATLKDKLPHEASKYFSDLPHKIYPHVTAGDMVKAIQAAKPHAMEHLGREPELNEAAYLHHSNEHPRDFYSRLAGQSDKLPDNVLSLAERGNPTDSGLQAPRGQAFDQRTTAGR